MGSVPADMKPEIPSTTQHKESLVAHTCDPNTVRKRKVVQLPGNPPQQHGKFEASLRQEPVSKHKTTKNPTGNYLKETGHCVANISSEVRILPINSQFL